MARSTRGIFSECRATLALAWPIITGQLAVVGMNLVDTIAAGRVSALVLAEVGVGTAMWGVANLLMVGCMMALSPEISRQRGADEPDFSATLAQAIYLALGLAAICFVYVLFAPHLMQLAGVDPAIVPGASEFLRGICFGLPALCVYITLLKFCEGMGRTKPSLYFGGLGLLLLIPLSFGFVQGQFGLPRWLAFGCGFATAIVHWCICLALLIYVRTQFQAHQVLRHWPRLDWRRVKELAMRGLPVALMILMEAGLFFAAMLLASRFGHAWAAAHIVAINVASLAFMLPLGLANAVTVRCGFYFGRRDFAAIWRVAQSGWLLCIASQGMSALIMLSAATFIVQLYMPNDPAVGMLAVQLLVLAAIFQFPDGIQAVSAGALRGVMDTRVPMLLAGLSYWGLGFPIAYWLALHSHWQARGLWLGFIIGLSAAALLLTTRFFIRMRQCETQSFTPKTLDSSIGEP